MNAALRFTVARWGGSQAQTCSGNEICLVICARSGRGPWALTNLSTELRSGEGLEAEAWGELKEAGVDRVPAGAYVPCVPVCAHAPGVYLSPKVCFFLVSVDVL